MVGDYLGRVKHFKAELHVVCLIYTKIYGYTSMFKHISVIFAKRNNLSDFLLAVLDNAALSK